MRKEITVRLASNHIQDFLMFIKMELNEMHQQHRFAVLLGESIEIRPPAGVGRLKIEKGIFEIVITLLSSGGAIAFFSVLKEWLRQRKAKVDIIDQRKGMHISFDGVLNEDNKTFLENLINEFQDKNTINSKDKGR